MTSFWEKHMFQLDFAIIGGGLLGLWTGLELRKKYPKNKIAIFERGVIPQGASTRNAGFSCFGSATELLSNFESIGESKTLEIVEKRWLGMQKINHTFTDVDIDYHHLGGYELLFDNKDYQDKINILNQKLKTIFKQDVFEIQNKKISDFGFQQVHSIIENSLEGQLHSGKLVYHLIEKCGREGIRYVTGADIAMNGGRFYLDKNEIKADKFIITTNAFTPDFIQNVKPGRGQVIITKPIDNLKLQGTFHFDEGYYYFRDVDNRVLFGGGRNIDFDSETTSEFGLNEKIQADLLQKLNTIILPNQTFEIDMQWSGIMAFSEDHLPRIEQYSDRIIYAMNCNGMGVSLSPISAEDIVKIV